MSSKNKAMYHCSPGPRENNISGDYIQCTSGGRMHSIGKGGSSQILHFNFDHLPVPSSGVKIMGLLGMIS